MITFARCCAVIAFALLVFFGYQWLNQQEGQRFFFLTDRQSLAVDWGTVAPLAISMLVGMFFGTLFHFLQAQRKKVKWRELFRAYALQKATVMALLASPLMFFCVMKVVGNQVDDLSDFLLAFQNGFFWQTAFATLEAP